MLILYPLKAIVCSQDTNPPESLLNPTLSSDHLTSGGLARVSTPIPKVVFSFWKKAHLIYPPYRCIKCILLMRSRLLKLMSGFMPTSATFSYVISVSLCHHCGWQFRVFFIWLSVKFECFCQLFNEVYFYLTAMFQTCFITFVIPLLPFCIIS